MEEHAACSIVRFADEENPLKLTYKSKTMLELVEAIRKTKGWSSDRRLRLVLAGRELLDDESVCAATAPVLHCVVLDEEASAHHARQSSHRAATAHQHPSVDWIDSLDPGTALMYFFGLLLGLLWLTYVCSGDSMFDRSSIILLCTMTTMYMVPWLLPYCPWLSAWLSRQNCSPALRLPPPGYMFYEGPMGDRHAVPPRPHARPTAHS